jgi:hypothetical protein
MIPVFLKSSKKLDAEKLTSFEGSDLLAIKIKSRHKSMTGGTS